MKLTESQLHTFISHDSLYSLHVLEGDKVIADLVTMHQIGGASINFLRTMVLGGRLLCAHMKGLEEAGFYFDNESPEFKFKLETGAVKPIRVMLIPADIPDFADSMTGLLRVVRETGNGKEPYKSAIKLEGASTETILNELITKSYQQRSKICVSDATDRAFMLSQLPQTQREKAESKGREDFEQFCKSMHEGILSLVDGLPFNPSAASDIGFKHLISKPIKIGCDCSLEKAVSGIAMLDEATRQEEFAISDPLSLTCEYCKSSYEVGSIDVSKFLSSLN